MWFYWVLLSAIMLGFTYTRIRKQNPDVKYSRQSGLQDPFQWRRDFFTPSRDPKRH